MTLPLTGLTVIELANVVAGPAVGKHLSDFGADVIKVERPGAGDATRTLGQSIGSRSAWWLVVGRNKRSVTLDLAHEKGREALLRLARRADAHEVVIAHRPQTGEPTAIRTRNPVICLVAEEYLRHDWVLQKAKAITNVDEWDRWWRSEPDLRAVMLGRLLADAPATAAPA